MSNEQETFDELRKQLATLETRLRELPPLLAEQQRQQAQREWRLNLCLWGLALVGGFTVGEILAKWVIFLA